MNEFNCDVIVVDAIMGAGKTESIIKYINDSDKDDRFIVITPFLEEVKRYKKYCKSKNFQTPIFSNGKSKFSDLKERMSKGENIVSTHAMFQKFDNEVIDLCRAQNYTLIMDEVADVIEERKISEYDFNTLMKYTTIDEETKQLHWKQEYKTYKGRFSEEKNLCDLGSLVIYGKSLIMWLFPVEVFNSFRKVFILTYMFDAQLQKYYYDYYKLKYSYMSVEGEYGTYHLTDKEKEYTPKYNYKNLIHIIDNNKLNMIGDRQTDLSKTWYERNKSNGTMNVIKKALNNYFNNIRNTHAGKCIWTTFKPYKEKLKGKGYTKGFIPSNSRATNEYRDATDVAYMINKYINPLVKNFFEINKISVDEDGYALSEMLQFIWRSAIRDGNEIWLYIPSIRMRTLLIDWIEKTSNTNNN